MRRLFLVLCTLLLIRGMADELGACTSKNPFEIDIRTGSFRTVSSSQFICYDGLWSGAPTSDMKLFVNGVETATFQGTGTYDWSSRRPGIYSLELKTYTDGALSGETLNTTFEVVGRDLVNAEVSFGDEAVLYDGTASEPHPIVKYQGKVLVENVDYAVSWEDNAGPGVGKVIITGKGDYFDEIERVFVIRPAGMCFLDLTKGPRVAHCPEPVAYDESWFSTPDAGYVRIMENGTKVMQANGTGVYEWNVTVPGTYTLLHRTYVDGYLQSDVYSATFVVEGAKTEPEVKDVVARQRYPWNGLVDVIFTITGDIGTTYDVSFTAKDLVGNTNLTMKTLYKSDGAAANAAKEQLLPGTYNWVWDVTADLGEGVVLDHVTVSVNVQ